MHISPKIQQKLKVATAVTGAMLASVSPVFADEEFTAIDLTPTANKGFFTNPNDLISRLLSIIMVIGVILVFAYLVLGGIEYITSGGEKGKTEAARNKITSAVIGLIILASSYAILTIVLRFLGTNTTNVLDLSTL